MLSEAQPCRGPWPHHASLQARSLRKGTHKVNLDAHIHLMGIGNTKCRICESLRIRYESNSGGVNKKTSFFLTQDWDLLAEDTSWVVLLTPLGMDNWFAIGKQATRLHPSDNKVHSYIAWLLCHRPAVRCHPEWETLSYIFPCPSKSSSPTAPHCGTTATKLHPGRM